MKSIWQDTVGRTLREVLETTCEQKAEDLIVDNADLEWYQGDLDATVRRVYRAPDSASEALVTDTLAWVDYPTRICVYEAQEWEEGEGLGWIQLGAEVLQSPIEVVNPWSGATVGLTPEDVSQERLDAMAPFMDDAIREELHMELAPCSPFEFFRAYVEKVGEEEAGKIWFS